MKIIVTGATGLVGNEVLRQAVNHNSIEHISALIRSPLNFNHSKVTTIHHTNFLDYSMYSDLFLASDAMVWCLGISQTQVSREQYHEITYDYAIAAASAIKKINPKMTFIFVSGEGADRKEKSFSRFARIKGKTENGLLNLGLSDVYIVRPAGIRPMHKNAKTALVNRLIIPFYPLLERIIPNFVIRSNHLALALIAILIQKPKFYLFSHKELKSWAIKT